MKQFIHAILTAAATVLIAGSASAESKNIDAAIRKDINDYMKQYGKSCEALPCEFATVSSKKLFEEIPLIQQQKQLKTLAYDVESVDGKTAIQFQFAAYENMRMVVRDGSGKVTSAGLLSGGKCYTSQDGIQFRLVADNTPEAKKLHLLYDLNMRFADAAKKVSVQTFDTFKFGKDDNGKHEIVKEPLEMLVDGKRCCCMDVTFQNRYYSTSARIYVLAEGVLGNISRINLADPSIKMLFTRFMSLDGFVYPGSIDTDANGTASMMIKNVKINKDIPAAEFKPDVL